MPNLDLATSTIVPYLSLADASVQDHSIGDKQFPGLHNDCSWIWAMVDTEICRGPGRDRTSDQRIMSPRRIVRRARSRAIYAGQDPLLVHWVVLRFAPYRWVSGTASGTLSDGTRQRSAVVHQRRCDETTALWTWGINSPIDGNRRVIARKARPKRHPGPRQRAGSVSERTHPRGCEDAYGIDVKALPRHVHRPDRSSDPNGVSPRHRAFHRDDR
jgi:hypothetical protein